MTGRSASKSPAPTGRRSRHSTPTRSVASPPPRTRSSAAHLLDPSAAASSTVPSLAPLVSSSAPGLGVPKSPSMRALSPRAAARPQRPALPVKHANKLMNPPEGPSSVSSTPKEKKAHRVKTQILDLGDDNGHIGIARVKVPVPKGTPGHIIKRFDTNAVSASSMFRAAYPTASEQDEAAEMRWITTGSRGKYGDTAAAGNEADETKKLSGTWIPAEAALELAREYSIQRFTTELINYEPKVGEVPEASESAAKSAAADERAGGTAVEETHSPRASKRARVSASDVPQPQALSGASAEGVSIHQTLATAPDTGLVVEETEVRLDVPLDPSSEPGNALVASEEQIEAQLAQARDLVESLKESCALADLADESRIPGTSSAAKKRVLEQDEDDESVPTAGTLADVDGSQALVDNRSFLGKLFRRKQRRVPVQGGRETRALPSREVAIALPEEEQQEAEGRRWVAGFGLAVAVGATAAAPYLFG
ncbi:hypothetical protein JCM10212_004012 [Sporobolomyces blumeae]